jgi:hypothetical protein
MALIFENLFGNCPVCEQSFRDHYCAVLAETSHDGSDTQKDFLAAFVSRHWDSILYKFTHVSTGYLPLRLFAIRCITNRIAVVVVSYVDVFIIEPEIFDYVVLDGSESMKLATLIKDEDWIPFDDKARRLWNRIKGKGASIFEREA